MTRKLRILTAVSVPLTMLIGCMNMPTQPSQITGSHTSIIKFMNYECSKLAAEVDFLESRENQLVTAQEQRIKATWVQMFWWGSGKRDGLEASKLAKVRGKKIAVRNAIAVKGCNLQYSLK